MESVDLYRKTTQKLVDKESYWQTSGHEAGRQSDE